jgi:hypothetical protein
VVTQAAGGLRRKNRLLITDTKEFEERSARQKNVRWFKFMASDRVIVLRNIELNQSERPGSWNRNRATRGQNHSNFVTK